MKYIYSLIRWILTFQIGCGSEPVLFNSDGRLVLFTLQSTNELEKLILLNVDTGDIFELNDFIDFQNASLILFKNGKKIFINERSAAYFSIFDISQNSISRIYKAESSSLLMLYHDLSIQHDTLYFANQSSIIAYSLDDEKILNEYQTNSAIFEFAVRNRYNIAVVHSSFDFENKSESLSNINLYIFNDNHEKVDLNVIGILTKWSANGEYLLFIKELIPNIIQYPSLKRIELIGLNQDSLRIVGESYFIDNHTLIFPASKHSNDQTQRNLYLYDIKENRITKQITNSGDIKEIKSTAY